MVKDPSRNLFLSQSLIPQLALTVFLPLLTYPSQVAATKPFTEEWGDGPYEHFFQVNLLLSHKCCKAEGQRVTVTSCLCTP
jgi:hypothetical protein